MALNIDKTEIDITNSINEKPLFLNDLVALEEIINQKVIFKIIKTQIWNANKFMKIHLKCKYFINKFSAIGALENMFESCSLDNLQQQDLANKLCVKKNIVNDLECGKILKNDKVIRKALNILKIK